MPVAPPSSRDVLADIRRVCGVVGKSARVILEVLPTGEVRVTDVSM